MLFLENQTCQVKFYYPRPCKEDAAVRQGTRGAGSERYGRVAAGASPRSHLRRLRSRGTLSVAFWVPAVRWCPFCSEHRRHLSHLATTWPEDRLRPGDAGAL